MSLAGSAPVQAPPSRRRLGSRQAWILAVCCVAQFMVILDLSIVNVALPNMQASLNFSSPELQWIVDAYAISFAGFLMLAGRVADYFGQRKTIVIALLLFALASLAGGIAPTREILIGARAFQGLAGAFMAAASLAIITASFEPGPKLHRAIGLWAAMNGLGGAAGVLLGGIITEALSWRWVLLINPPIGVIAAGVALSVVADRRRRREGNFDLSGALLLTVGQMVLVYGIVEAGLAGWSSAAALGPIVGGLALLMLFNFVEVRLASSPLIPFKDITKGLGIANTIVLLFSASLFPMWFVSSLYLQQVLGLSPLATGLTFLPMALTIMLVARGAGKLVTRFGVRSVLGGGLMMMTGGMLLFSRIEPSGSAIVYVMIPGILTAAGIGASIVPSTIAATQGSKEGQAGLASGLVNTSRQAGGGLGLAILITLATQRTTGVIGAGHSVPQGLTAGFQLAYLIGAGLTAAAAVVTFAMLPRAAHAPGPRLRAAVPAIAVTGVLACFAGIAFGIGTPRGAPIGAYKLEGAYSFLSAPSLHPPKLQRYEAEGAKLAGGYIFAANFYDLSKPPMIGQSGPLILDRSLQPVWFKPVSEKVVASNLSLQKYEGKPALAYWQGVVSKTGATESGEYVVLNDHYQTVARLKGADGWKLTLHELIIDGQHAWVTANKNIAMNLSRWGGTYNGTLTDSAVQEYDLKTGRLIRSWDALKHLPLADSHGLVQTNGFPWDAYHVNSIQLVGKSSFLVSMRDMWAAYMVNIETGKIEWSLGGRKSSFRFGPGAEFSWQHDVRLRPDNVVTMFDDHCCQIKSGGTYVEAPKPPSRGLALKLDMAHHTVARIAQYGRGSGLETDYMGSMQPMSNGNVFVGWGSEPYFSEYSRSGKLLFEGGLPGSDLSYRTELHPWVGRPLYPPSGAAVTADGRTTVYASWNGATQVASWRVLAASSASEVKAPLVQSAKVGFQTAIPLPSGHYGSFKIQALDSSGKVIGTSKPFTAAPAG